MSLGVQELTQAQTAQTQPADLQKPTPAECCLQEISTANCAEKIHFENPEEKAGRRSRFEGLTSWNLAQKKR
jgi:hypothetical protein